MNDSPLAVNVVEPAGWRTPRSITAAEEKRHIVIVLGTGGCGTSLCSHVLSILGINMADRVGSGASPLPDSPEGQSERWEIVDWHDRVLRFFNRNYYNPLPLPVAWWADPRVVQTRREIVAFIKTKIGEDLLGFKDPCTMRMLPMWKQILNELKLSPKFILCLRNPAQVAQSLNNHGGLNAELGEYLWFVSTIEFFRYGSNHEFCTIEYEDWFADPSVNLKKLRDFLAINWVASEIDLDLVVSEIVHTQIRNDDRRESRQPMIRLLHKLARTADRDQAARDQIQHLASQFVTFQQFQAPVHRAFDEMAGLKELAVRISQDSATLKAIVAEVERQYAEIKVLVEETERVRDESAADLQRAENDSAELRHLLDERERAIGTARERLTESERQCDESAAARSRVEQEAAALGSALVERDAALTAANDRAAASEARLAEAQFEIEVARERLTESDRARDESAAAKVRAETQLVQMRASVEEARAEIARLCEGMAKVGATAAASQTELASVREQLAASQTELASVREQLAASRQVSKDLLAAMRTEVLLTPEPVELVRWWRRLLSLPSLRLAGRRLSPAE